MLMSARRGAEADGVEAAHRLLLVGEQQRDVRRVALAHVDRRPAARPRALVVEVPDPALDLPGREHQRAGGVRVLDRGLHFLLGRRGAVSIRYNSLTFDLLLFAASLAIEVAPALFWMDVWFLRLTSRDLGRIERP